MSYLKKILSNHVPEIALSKNVAERSYGSELEVNSTRIESERVVKVIQRYGKDKGAKYKRTLSSAMFEMTFNVDGLNLFTVDGWHGTGNYGDGFMLLDVFGRSYKENFKFINNNRIDFIGNTAYFMTIEDKNSYLAALKKVEKAFLTDKVQSLF